MQDYHLSRDFPREITEREARFGFDGWALFRIVDGDRVDLWTRVVAKVRSASEAIVKVSFQGGVRYQLFRHGHSCMDQSAKRAYWFTVGGKSCDDFGLVELETDIGARDDPDGMVLVPAEIQRVEEK
jgi:hypothetical protein